MSAADAVNDLVVAELVQLPLALDHALAPASDTEYRWCILRPP